MARDKWDFSPYQNARDTFEQIMHLPQTAIATLLIYFDNKDEPLVNLTYYCTSIIFSRLDLHFLDMDHNFSNYIDDDNMVTIRDDVDDVKAAAASFMMYKIG